MICRFREVDLADARTKADGYITQELQLFLKYSCLLIEFTAAITQSSNLSTF